MATAKAMSKINQMGLTTPRNIKTTQTYQKGGALFTRNILYLLVFAQLQAMFLECTAIAGEPDLTDQCNLWDKFFVLFGEFPSLSKRCISFFGRFIADILYRACAICAVTDRRVILLSEFPGHNTRSVSLSGSSDISRSKIAGGHGTIAFGAANYVYGARLAQRHPQHGSHIQEHCAR